MFAKSRIEIEILDNLRKPLTQKYEKTHWHWLWKGFLYLRTGAAHKNKKTFGFAQVALAVRFKKNSLPEDWIPR